jgi:hypothetical protein
VFSENQHNNHLQRRFEALPPKGSEMKLAPMPTTKSIIQIASKMSQGNPHHKTK